MIRTNRDRRGNSSCRGNPLAKTLAFAIELGLFSCRGYGKLVVALQLRRYSVRAFGIHSLFALHDRGHCEFGIFLAFWLFVSGFFSNPNGREFR